MFVGLNLAKFVKIGRVVSSHEWLQTDRQTHTHTNTHTPGSVFFHPDDRNKFYLFKRINVKTHG